MERLRGSDGGEKTRVLLVPQTVQLEYVQGVIRLLQFLKFVFSTIGGYNLKKRRWTIS